MKTCKLCGETKDESCFYKQKECKGGLRPECKTCFAAKGKKHRDANKDVIKARSAKYRAENKAKIAETNRRYYNQDLESNRAKRREYAAANKEATLARVKRWQDANPDKVRATKQRYKENNPHVVKAEYERNKHQYVERAIKRKRRIEEVTPKWSDADVVAEYYRAAAAFSKHFPDYEFHVDHIVPVQGKTVCGLHAHTNLQILLSHENQSKSNRFWPDMP